MTTPKRRRLTYEEAAELRIVAAHAAQKANPANPLAAARALPALLEACKFTERILDVLMGNGVYEARQMLKAAIAQAEGEE